jgi:hypothetical protein
MRDAITASGEIYEQRPLTYIPSKKNEKENYSYFRNFGSTLL